MKPITPQEAKAKKIELMPDFVIEAVNELIIQGMENHKTSFSIAQQKIIDRIKSKMPDGTEWSQAFLDFEPIYRKNGWKVVYEKGAWNETGDSYFNFEATQ